LIVTLYSLLFLAGLIRSIEPVGRQFLAHARRKLNNHSFAEDERIQLEAATEQAEEVISEDSEEETPELLNRDPKDWKVIVILGQIDVSFEFN
jgi:DnaJ homolog subfamily C member 2